MTPPSFKVKPMLAGVYSLRHVPTGSEYIGSSTWCVANRLSVHLTLLKRGIHSCHNLQSLWDKTIPDEWEFLILSPEIDPLTREQETYWISQSKSPLNHKKTANGVGYTMPEETKQKMRDSRQEYLKTPESRQSLSERAKKQHTDGNFGAHTWKTGPDYEKISEKWTRTEKNKERLREHIREQTSEEMSRRSRCRKIFRGGSDDN